MKYFIFLWLWEDVRSTVLCLVGTGINVSQKASWKKNMLSLPVARAHVLLFRSAWLKKTEGIKALHMLKKRHSIYVN